MKNYYPENTWTNEDIDKFKSKYLSGVNKTECPVCKGWVVIEKQEGKEFLKKEYVDTHFFLNFECRECKRRDTRTYGKSSRITI